MSTPKISGVSVSLEGGHFSGESFTEPAKGEHNMVTCSICNGPKLLPFKRKDGTIVPNTFLDCQCKVDEPDQYHELRPEDFDFSCSQAVRAYYTERYGYPWERSGGLYQPEEQSVVAASPVSQPWDKRQNYQIDQMRAELINLNHKLAEMTKPKPKQPQKSTYKGLVVNDGN